RSPEAKGQPIRVGGSTSTTRVLPARAVEPYVPLILRHGVEELERTQTSPAELERAHAMALVDRSIEAYIGRCRSRIPSFEAANYSLEQTWALQRPTLWRDLAYAPFNAAWALPSLAIYKAAEAAEKVGSSHAGRAKRLPMGIKTGYQRQI